MLLAEIKEGALWRSISVIEVLARPRSVIRCAHCHQRLVAHGSFQPSATPHFVHYRMKRPCVPVHLREGRRDVA